MNCKVCGKDSDRFVLLPIQISGKKGKNDIVCLKCAKKSSHYCKKHEIPHTSYAFSDKTLCIECTNEGVKENSYRAGEIMKNLCLQLPKEEAERLEYWAIDTGVHIDWTKEGWVLRSLIMLSLRENWTLEDTIKNVIKNKSVDGVVAPAY